MLHNSHFSLLELPIPATQGYLQTAIKSKTSILQPEALRVQPCAVLDSAGTPPLFLSSNVFLLECKHLTYACPSTVFWKCVTYLVSQVHKARGTLPQDECTSSLSHL